VLGLNLVDQVTLMETEVLEAINPEETVLKQYQLGQVFNKRKAATT
jgi:hypothetical protein